jgi:hypothetical protein
MKLQQALFELQRECWGAADLATCRFYVHALGACELQMCC